MSGRFRIWFCVLGLSGLSVWAQQTPPAADHRIRLDVTVTDKTGNLFPGLEQKDFTLLDNTAPQTLTSFRALAATNPDPPLELVFFIDEMNATYQTVTNARFRLRQFLTQNDGKLAAPASMAFFADRGVRMGAAPTRDGNALAAQMDENEHGLRESRRSQGFYGAAERMQDSLNALGALVNQLQSRPGRKIVIWISPGWALLTGPRIQLTQKNQAEIFRLIVGISDSLRKARITLYNVDPLGVEEAGSLRTTYYKEYLKGVKKPSQTNYANLSLQVLATQSGGLVLNSSNDIAAQVARCVADVNTYYEVSYDPPAADGPDDYHAIEIKINRPGLIARTRTGYYAQP